ncbi:MAG: LlaMI family restriction endonuclease [Endozoicomonadaceae bacterium]|nr:LlaMI family restriction endonuclease [Endozoicomonadaceae bacterium]
MNTDDAIQKITELFKNNVQGKRADTSSSNARHDGKEGHWLERQMGIDPNANNEADIFGFEMKKQTRGKTTFGDWSANYYLFKNSNNTLTRDGGFLPIFGKSNEDKNGRYSWSGEPCPNIYRYNIFGQKLIVDNEENILAVYRFSEDQRNNKHDIVPIELQQEDLILAKWDKEGDKGIKVKLERKFNQKGWFRCEKNNAGIYTSIAIGSPISWNQWIKHVKTGEVYFDSGMYQGNPRNYSQWRANNSFWDELIINHIS